MTAPDSHGPDAAVDPQALRALADDYDLVREDVSKVSPALRAAADTISAFTGGVRYRGWACPVCMGWGKAERRRGAGA